MTVNDKLDICEALYGKMTKALGIFYWSEDKTHLVNIETGEDLLGHVVRSRYGVVSYINKQYVKVCRRAVFVKDKDEYVTCYNYDCKPIVRIELNRIPPSYIKEYISDKDRLAIYLLGRKSVVRGMRILVVDLNTNKMVSHLNNVVRVFESEQKLKIIFLKNGELSSMLVNL